MCASVYCLSSINDLAKFWTQFGVCCIARGPESVSSDLGDDIVVKVSDPSWM